MRLKRGSRPYTILKYAALGGGVLVLSILAPENGARLAQDVLRVYFRKKRFEKNRLLEDVRRLQARELVKYRGFPDGRIEIVLEKRGKQEMITRRMDDLKLDVNRPWDRKWRMVLFDIPHSEKKARDAFRGMLARLGFYALQKSVFIVPHQCEEEIEFVCSIFGIRDYVLLMYVSHFEGEEKMRNYFKI